jgi:hypothetical protein
MILLQNESYDEIDKLEKGTVEWQAHKLGLKEGEPLLYALDGLLRYAKAYKRRYGSDLASDYALSEPWLDALKSIRFLLAGYGAVAMERDISTDSKSNGDCEGIFWQAIEIAGFSEADI